MDVHKSFIGFDGFPMGPIRFLQDSHGCILVMGMMLSLVMMCVEMKRMSMKMVIYMNEAAILITDVQVNQHPEHQEISGVS